MNTLFKFSGVHSLDSLIRANDRFYYTLLEGKPYHFFNTALFFLENRDQELLKHQFSLAIGIHQMISNWHTIQTMKERYPFLEIDSVIDGVTSPIERKLDGIIRHVDDPFWDIYFPLNFEHDRSTVRSLKDAKETPINELPILKPEFRRNFGKPFIISTDNIPFAIPYIDENIEVIKSFY